MPIPPPCPLISISTDMGTSVGRRCDGLHGAVRVQDHASLIRLEDHCSVVTRALRTPCDVVLDHRWSHPTIAHLVQGMARVLQPAPAAVAARMVQCEQATISLFAEAAARTVGEQAARPRAAVGHGFALISCFSGGFN